MPEIKSPDTTLSDRTGYDDLQELNGFPTTEALQLHLPRTVATRQGGRKRRKFLCLR